jgi:hypothetical protein
MRQDPTRFILGNGLATIEFHQLSNYNGERARGIMHTDEWCAKMALIQEQYDKVVAAGGLELE